MFNTVTHERIYASGGKLVYVDIGAYRIKATDVRCVILKPNTTVKLVWEESPVSALVKKYNADFGINAPFFWQGVPVADCIASGKILNQGYGKQTTWHGFAVKNGVSSLGQFDVHNGYDTLIKTTPYLISNGNPCWDYYQALEGTAHDIGKDENGNLIRAQRTFLGIDKDGNLIICASDGRTNSDQGLTLEEMSLYMQAKGAINAINFDGGSSTVLADKTGMLNAQPNGEELVHHALLFSINADPVIVPPAKDWKQEGLDYLVQNYALDAKQWTPTSAVDIGTLGSILKRHDKK